MKRFAETYYRMRRTCYRKSHILGTVFLFGLLLMMKGNLNAQNNTIISGNYLWTAKKLILVDSTNSFPLSVHFKAISADTLSFNQVFRQDGTLRGEYRKVPIEDLKRGGLLASWQFENQNISQLQKLLIEERINEVEFSALAAQIENPNSQSLDGLRQFGVNRPSGLNPFFLSQQYQLVFELEITNHSAEVLELQNTFSIFDYRGNSHVAHRCESIMAYHGDYPNNQISAAYREILNSVYFPDILYLPPKSRTKKLIAFPPSILESDTVEIFHYGNPTTATFAVKREQKIEGLTFEFANFDHLFRHGSFFFKESQLYIHSTSFPIYREDDQILVNQEHLDQETDLIIVGLIGQETYFLRISNLVFSEYLAAPDENNKALEGNLKKLKAEE